MVVLRVTPTVKNQTIDSFLDDKGGEGTSWALTDSLAIPAIPWYISMVDHSRDEILGVSLERLQSWRKNALVPPEILIVSIRRVALGS